MIRLTQSQVIKNSDVLKSYIKFPVKENSNYNLGNVKWVGEDVTVTYRDNDGCFYYEFNDPQVETMALLKLQL